MRFAPTYKLLKCLISGRCGISNTSLSAWEDCVGDPTSTRDEIFQ